MSRYNEPDNMWAQPPQGQYNFEPSGFDQPNQQFDFENYSTEQSSNYSYSQPYLDPTQNSYAGEMMYPSADYGNGVPTDPAQIQQPILVCTAHIHWDPEYCDVKLIQTMMLSNELRSMLEQASQSFRPGHKPDASNVQLLLCGDFNSLPDSGVIEFLTSGRVASDHRDFKELTYKSCLQKISGCDKPNEFIHSFKLASAYSEDIMPYTNYTYDFKGIIDYIFYSKLNMTPLGILGPLSADWFRENSVVGCPHPHIPSDHFPLLVELEMTPQGTSNGLISRR